MPVAIRGRLIPTVGLQLRFHCVANSILGRAAGDGGDRSGSGGEMRSEPQPAVICPTSELKRQFGGK